MTRQARKLAALAEIAALIALQAQAPVAQAQARLVAQQRIVTALAAQRAGLAMDADCPLVAGRMGRQGAALRGQQHAAMAELAGLQAAVDVARMAAQRPMARKLVLARLAAKAAAKG
jgi:hypothetical protein